MATGKVKWFSAEKGYGFIIPDEKGEDIFLHRTAIQDKAYVPVENDRVSFDVVPGRKSDKTQAGKVVKA